MNLYFIGPRGCGKSAVGQAVAERLGWDWIDLDQRIQAAVGKSIAELFATQGQGRFRDLESQHLLEVVQESRLEPCVVSLGGGAVLRPENRRLLSTSGYTILLVAEPKVLVQRMQSDPASDQQRPPLTESGDDPWSLLEETQHVLALRLPTYQQSANLKLDTSQLSVAEVSQQVLRWLPRMDSQIDIPPAEEVEPS